MPKISVIMGVNNGEKTLSRSINSILKQTYTDFEFIICDDGSTDSTYQILKECEQKDNRIIILQNKEKSGVATALNKCIEIAKGEYIAIMDDDDISDENRLEVESKFLDEHKKYAIVGCRKKKFDDKGVWDIENRSGELTKYDIIKCNIFTHASVLMRKEAVIKSGKYTTGKRTMRGQDFDLWCKMYANGYIGYILPDILFNYYEDRNKIKEIKPKYRINNFKTHLIWRKKMKLPLFYDIYAYKQLIAILIPQKLLVKYKQRRKNKE